MTNALLAGSEAFLSVINVIMIGQKCLPCNSAPTRASTPAFQGTPLKPLTACCARYAPFCRCCCESSSRPCVWLLCRSQWLRQSCKLIMLCSAVLQMPPLTTLKSAPVSGAARLTSSPMSSPAKGSNPTSDTFKAEKLGHTVSGVDSPTSPSKSSAGMVSGSKPDSAQAQQLLQTASARLLMVLTDDKLWKCFEPGTF